VRVGGPAGAAGPAAPGGGGGGTARWRERGGGGGGGGGMHGASTEAGYYLAGGGRKVQLEVFAEICRKNRVQVRGSEFHGKDCRTEIRTIAPHRCIRGRRAGMCQGHRVLGASSVAGALSLHEGNEHLLLLGSTLRCDQVFHARHACNELVAATSRRSFQPWSPCAGRRPACMHSNEPRQVQQTGTATYAPLPF